MAAAAILNLIHRS